MRKILLPRNLESREDKTALGWGVTRTKSVCGLRTDTGGSEVKFISNSFGPPGKGELRSTLTCTAGHRACGPERHKAEQVTPQAYLQFTVSCRAQLGRENAGDTTPPGRRPRHLPLG